MELTTMSKIFFGIVITGVVALSFAFSFEMETAFLKTEKNIQWTIKNLNELNFMTSTTSYGSNCLESSPFFPFENSREEWVIGLFTSGARLSDGPVMDFYIRSLDSRKTSDQLIDGTVTFKNSTNHALHMKKIKKSVLIWNERAKHSPERLVSIIPPLKLLHMFEEGTFPPGGNYLPSVMEKLNNQLILEFSLNIVAPVTTFIN